MDKGNFQGRTKRFALNVIHLVESLPRNRATEVLGRQLLRSGTSVGANYRAACRARSRADFASKMGIVEEEADECMYWLDLLVESQNASSEQVADLSREANEMVSMAVASIRTARGKQK